MRQLELSDFDSRELLSAYLEGVLSHYEKEKIRAILSYDLNEECFLEFPGMISFEDTMLSPEGYALIFEGGSCLYLRMIAESKVRIGTFELSETDNETIASFSCRDFLNISEFVYEAMDGIFLPLCPHAKREARRGNCFRPLHIGDDPADKPQEADLSIGDDQ